MRIVLMYGKLPNFRNCWVLGLILCLLTLSGISFATSIRQMNFDELLEGSELVFDGEVIDIVTDSSRPAAPGSRPMIFTRVTFRIIEIIKGTYNNSNIELSFLGGSKNGKSLVIEEMQFPKPGEQGIYFVERVGRKQVHPLYGWSQGHFLVVADPGGTKRVMTSNSQSITGVQSTGGKLAVKLSKGVVNGLKLKSSDALSSAMRADEFKRLLVDMQKETKR